MDNEKPYIIDYIEANKGRFDRLALAIQELTRRAMPLIIANAKHSEQPVIERPQNDQIAFFESEIKFIALDALAAMLLNASGHRITFADSSPITPYTSASYRRAIAQTTSALAESAVTQLNGIDGVGTVRLLEISKIDLITKRLEIVTLGKKTGMIRFHQQPTNDMWMKSFWESLGNDTKYVIRCIYAANVSEEALELALRNFRNILDHGSLRSEPEIQDLVNQMRLYALDQATSIKMSQNIGASIPPIEEIDELIQLAETAV